MAKTIGAFTEGVAKLSNYGPTTLDAEGSPSAAQLIYTALHPRGTEATRANTTGLPAANSAHPTYSNLLVSGVDFQLVSAAHGVWQITVNYGVREAASEGNEGSVSRITMKEWDVAESQLDISYDLDTGAAVLDAAGRPFDSVPQRQAYAPMVRFSRIQSTNPASLVAKSGTINTGAVTCLGVTFAARTGRIHVTGRDLMTDVAMHYEITVTIEGRNNYVKLGGNEINIGWDEAILNQGYYYLDGGTSYRFTEADEEGNTRPSAAPCLLTVAGGDGRGGAPSYRRARAYVLDSWAEFNLPG